MGWAAHSRYSSGTRLSGRRELEIGNSDFVVALHQESKFPIGEFMLGAVPGIERNPLLIFLDPLNQLFRRNFDLDSPGLILAIDVMLDFAMVAAFAVDHIADSKVVV